MQRATVRIDPHVHSDGSYDGHEPVELILEHAADIGLDAVVITDHDTMSESLRAAELAPEYDLIGIPGVEVSTAHGHLLAIGVEEMPPHRAPYDETVAWIHDHGGVAVVPHPFQRSRHGVRRRHVPVPGDEADGPAGDAADGDGDADAESPDMDAESPDRVPPRRGVDAVEVFNAWLFTGYRNRKARRFATVHDLPGVAASDAHTLQYVGRAFTEVEVEGAASAAEVTAADVLDAIRAGSTTVSGKRAPVPMAARHYAIAAARKSGYYAKTGAVKSAATAKWAAFSAASTARVGALQGAHRLARIAAWFR
ncbi:CehA/McbA family metallohydrolase [Haloparvum sedimenti]|uniref:CehA/McbA family metallohydrolase n=1 Tax=Haloparvum sedimenti TaxID=1678448 RepID=UPI00071E7D8A|nr:PHP domain-containing protein [Haloparvum sedimenti]